MGAAQPNSACRGARESKREQQLEARGAAAQSAGWVKGFGQWLSMDGNGNAADLDSAVGGVVAGYDVLSKDSMFGFAAGYSQASADVDSRASSTDTDTFLVSAYGAIRIDNNLKLSGGATYGWSWADSERLALGDKLTASYDGNTGSAFGEIAYVAKMGKAAIEPFAGISYIDVDEDGFTEAGGVGALTSDGQSFDSVSSTVGLRVAYEAVGANGTRVTPRASLAWRHAFGDLTPDAALRFADTGTGFTVSGVPIAQDSVVVGAGIDVGLSDNVTIGLDYTGAFADEATSNAGRAVGRIGF
ncbi:MAG: autotransporter outer membrane beta-barrel domain-containing protein [Hyphomicrobium sp.]